MSDSQLSNSHWQRVHQLFQQLVGQPEETVANVLADEPPIIARATQRLLSNDEELDPSTLTDHISAWVAETSAASILDTQLDRYQLVTRLGAGGAGVVYLAIRSDDAFRKKVAIKVLRALGNGSPGSLVERFHRERQILASLEHPAIAQILDGGTTTAGDAYAVMEYVDGLDIVTYCQRKKLTIEPRLKLFAALCEAVQFAHQNLVVHCDLKPSNILVTDQGQPKLLDFGVAGSLSSIEDQGIDGALGYTPAYASPEQLAGAPGTVLSDVFSLGALLFELVHGHRYRRSSAVDAVSDRRRARPGSHRPKPLVGTDDLTHIVDKALNHRPVDRYQSAAALVDDIKRYLERRPIRARPQNRAYVVVRFCQRNALGVVMTTALLVSSIVFAWSARQQAIQIASERDRAEAVSQILINAFAGADPNKTRGKEVTAEEILAQGARRLNRVLESRPSTAAAMAMTIADAQEGLGLYQDAYDTLNTTLVAIGQYDQLGDEQMALLHRLVLNALQRGNVDEAKSLSARFATLLTDQAPLETIRYHLQQGEISRSGARAQAVREFRAAYELAKDAYGDSDPLTINSHFKLASALRGLGQEEQAEQIFQQFYARADELDRVDHRLSNKVWFEMGYRAIDSGRYHEAEEIFLRVARNYDEIYGLDHLVQADVQTNLSEVYQSQQRLLESETAARKTIAIRRLHLGDDHPRVITAEYNLALVLADFDDRADETIETFESVIRRYGQAVGQEHVNLGVFLLNFGQFLVDQKRPETATDPLRRALTIHLKDNAPKGRNIAKSRVLLAQALLESGGERSEARQLLELALPVLAEQYGEESPYTRRARGLATRLDVTSPLNSSLGDPP